MNTNYYNKIIMEKICGISDTLPTIIYIGVSSTQPQITGVGAAEPDASSGYTRCKVDLTSANFKYDEGSLSVSNIKPFFFAPLSKPVGDLKYWVVFDSISGGNMLAYGLLSQIYDLAPDTTIAIPNNTIRFKIENK